MADLRRKLTIKLEPFVALEEPEPKRCELCLQMAPDWDFGEDRSAALICGNCLPRSGLHLSELSTGNLSWSDLSFIWRAKAVVVAIKREIKNGRAPVAR